VTIVDDVEDATTLVNPVSIQINPVDELERRSIAAITDNIDAPLDPDDEFPQLSWVRLSVDLFNIHSQQTASRTYHHIPAAGDGSAGTNYLETVFGYDVMNRRNRVVSAAGTITWSVFDVRSNVVSTWIGTNDDGATDSDPSNGGAAPNNMVQLNVNVFDNGEEGGDNNLTQTTQFVDDNSANDRVTDFTPDFRNRRVTTDGPMNYFQKNYFDNLSRTIKVEQYDDSESGNLLARSESKFDDRGRVYQTLVYAVNPDTGVVGVALVSNSWFDAAGNTLKSKPAGSNSWSKMVYDAVGRTIVTYFGYSTGTEDYTEAGSITTSIVFSQVVTSFDAASNVIETDSYQRFHTAPLFGSGSQGALNGPSGSDPKARISFVAMYPDGVGRVVNTADFGTNGDANSLSRPATCPARSDTVLVASAEYNDRGEANKTTDPKGQVTLQSWDDAGRKLELIQNYAATPTSADQNITTRWAYDTGGHLSALKAINADTGEQITAYSFGVTVAGGSAINSNDVLHVETAPDSGATVTEINRQGETILKSDPNGTVHAYVRDQLGRQTLDQVITLPEGIDGTIQRIEITYDVRGLVEKITCYDAATGGSVVNEIQNVYNDFGQLVSQYQSHQGEVSP